MALTSFVFIGWTWRTQGRLHLAEIIALSMIVAVTWLCGRSFLLLVNAHRLFDRSFPFVFITGMTVLGFCVTVLHVVSNVGLLGAFAIVVVAAVAIDIALARRLADWPETRQSRWYGVLTTITCLLSASFWMQHVFPQWVISDRVAVYRAFNEYFAHSSNLMPLLTPGSPFARGSIDYAGEPLSFYHWASYAFPALLSKLSSQPANDTLASLWYPMGTFVMGLSAASLGMVFAGRRAAYLACVMTIVVPDPTYWQSDIVFFSFHRLLEASPGMGFACAAATVAVALTVKGLRSTRGPLVGVGLVTAFGSAFFKVNIIVAVLPSLLLVMLLVPLRPSGARRWKWILLLLFLVALAYLAGSKVRSAPTFKLDRNVGGSYVEVITEFLPPRTLMASLGSIADSAGGIAAGPMRFIFVLLATFQAYMALYLMILFIVAWSRRGRPRSISTVAHGNHPFVGIRWYEWLVGASLLFYSLLAIGLAPNENGDPFELQHRAFCWYHMLLCVGVACPFTSFVDLGMKRLHLRGRFRYLVGLAALLAPLTLGRVSAMPVPDLAYPAGYYHAARYLRDHAVPDDVVLDSLYDPWQATIALSERRAFVCRADSYHFPGSGSLKEVRQRRREESDRLFSFNDKSAIMKWSRENRVRWCLLHPQTNVAWPEEFLSNPSFDSMNYRVYDLSR